MNPIRLVGVMPTLGARLWDTKSQQEVRLRTGIRCGRQVGEGQLQDITPSEISISVEGLLFEGLRERTWRIDKGNNRLSYGRQLGSLVSLCTGSRPKAGRGDVGCMNASHCFVWVEGEKCGAFWSRFREALGD